MVPLTGGRFARACSPSGISMGLPKDQSLQTTIGRRGNKVMAVRTPANPATRNI